LLAAFGAVFCAFVAAGKAAKTQQSITIKRVIFFGFKHSTTTCYVNSRLIKNAWKNRVKKEKRSA